ncbi:MAG: UDP-glucuronic acid decarboxylase family protein [Acidobacteriota bacterium]
MRIVITGGAGFLGSHLVDRFLADGHRVAVFDNMLTGRVANVAGHLGNSKFELFEHDVTLGLNVSGRVDAVLHFASPASPVDYLRYPIQTLKVGSLGTHKALGLAKEKKARFLLASTSEVYGDPEVHPQSESYWGHVNPVGPRGVYDEAKRFAEAMTMAYCRVHGLDTRIVRIFNTYGERMRLDDGRVVSNFIVQALRGEPLTVYGDGLQTRSFCFVSDLVEGIVRLLLHEGRPFVEGDVGYDQSEDIHLPVNMGSPFECTVLELAQCVVELAGSGSLVDFKPLPIDDPKVRRPDISRAAELLSWEPTVLLRCGLKSTISYFRDLLVREGD